MSSGDLRIGWIKCKVESGLFLEFQEAKKPPSLKAGKEGLVPIPPTVSDPFTECLQRDGGKNLQLLHSFLESPTEHALAIVFWAELVQKKTIVEIVAPVESNETQEHDLDEKAPQAQDDNQNEDPKLLDNSVVSFKFFILGYRSQSGSDQEDRNRGNNS
jgi:hypothetical protein